MDLVPPSVVDEFAKHGFVIFRIGETVARKIRAVYDVAPSFFRQTPALKISTSFPQDMGYRPCGIEYSQSSSFPDQVESFSVSAKVPIPPSQLNSKPAKSLHKHLLPAFDALESIAEAFAVVLASKLNDRDAGKHLVGGLRNWSRLQLNYCFPETLSFPLINEPHEDGNFVTVTCSTGPGLEVLVRDSFMPLTTGPGELLVIGGEIASLLSGGLLKPTFHRVVSHGELKERMALLFFADIDPDRCFPWIVNEANRNVDIGMRVWESVGRFGLKGFSKE